MTISLSQSSSSAISTQPNHVLWWILGLVLPMAILTLRGAPTFAEMGIPFDTAHSYLPLAKRFLENPAELFSSTDILKSAPGTLVYMASLGADLLAIKTANLAMALAILVMLFDIGRRVAGPSAAVAGAWLYAASPLLFPLSFIPMMEPPFLFFLVLWFWSTTCCILARPKAWIVVPSIIFAGLAMAAATLTRATYMYWLPAGVFLFGALALRPLWGDREIWRRLALIHLVALTCIGAYMVRNAHEFGKPVIAVGAGAALYFGSNPMLDGQEPPYFGLPHDEGWITGAATHLSIEGDARLVSTARLILADAPPLSVAKMYLHKAGSILFFSKSHLKNYVDRIWRSLLLTLSVISIWLGRRHPLIILLAGATIYQWAVHVPALYNQRYSISALEIPLTILAATGVGFLLQQKNRALMIFCTAICAFLTTLGALWHQRYSSPSLLDLEAIPHQLIRAANSKELQVSGFDADPFQDLSITSSGHINIRWTGDFPHFDPSNILRLRIKNIEGSCQRAIIKLTSTEGQTRSDDIRLKEFKAGQDFARGMLYLGLPGNAKTIELILECKAGSRIQFSELSIYQASLGQFYSKKKSEAASHLTTPP